MDSIDSVLREGYHYAVNLNLQQKGSKLSACVREEIQDTERYYYDQIGPTEAIDIRQRHADTPLIHTKFDRRMVTIVTSDWADLIDREDQLRFLNDPTSAYSLNAAYALGRKKDERIIKAAIGTAYCGPRGEQKIELPENQIIAVNYSDKDIKIEQGLTIDKLRMARQILDNADVDDDEEQYCVVSAKQVSDLLKTVEVTSEDYNTVKALVEGKVNTFMGFTFKRVSSNLLPMVQPETKRHRNIICFAKSGILLATLGDIKTDISLRVDKRMAKQVYASLSCGASRMDEKKVVSIICKE